MADYNTLYNRDQLIKPPFKSNDVEVTNKVDM